jgi:hypothetical protein
MAHSYKHEGYTFICDGDAAREALAVLAEYATEWSEDRDMSATIHYCRACMAYAHRLASGEIAGRHAPGCKLRAALDLAKALAPRR